MGPRFPSRQSKGPVEEALPNVNEELDNGLAHFPDGAEKGDAGVADGAVQIGDELDVNNFPPNGVAALDAEVEDNLPNDESFQSRTKHVDQNRQNQGLVLLGPNVKGPTFLPPSTAIANTPHSQAMISPSFPLNHRSPQSFSGLRPRPNVLPARGRNPEPQPDLPPPVSPFEEVVMKMFVYSGESLAPMISDDDLLVAFEELLEAHSDFLSDLAIQFAVSHGDMDDVDATATPNLGQIARPMAPTPGTGSALERIRNATRKGKGRKTIPEDDDEEMQDGNISEDDVGRPGPRVRWADAEGGASSSGNKG